MSASRLHAQSHDLITRVKPYVSEKTWVFPPLRPSFIDFSALFCGPMAYDKPKRVYTATSRRPMFSTQNGQGVPGRETGHSKSTVSRVRLPSHPLRWHNGVSSLPPGSRDSLVAVFLTVEINSEQNRLSPPTPLILNGESEGFSPLYGKITEMTSFWDNLPQPFFILAPMEAVTDVVFRHVVKRRVFHRICQCDRLGTCW